MEISYSTGPARTRERKYVEVISNDVSSGYNRIEVTAEIKSKPDTLLTLSYYPYILEFVEEKKGKIKEGKVEFTNTGKGEYRFQILDYPEDLFEAKLSSETLKPGEKINLKVKAVNKNIPVVIKKSITLKLEGEKEFRITIPIKKEKPGAQVTTSVKGK